jgi:outer membrane biosynthesis protein TonB
MQVYNMAPELQLPWESSLVDDARYRKILRNLLSAFLAFAILIPWLPVEELSREKQEAVPPHLARVIMEKKVLPKPIPVPVKPKPVEKKKPEPVEKKKPEPVVKKKPEPVVKPPPKVEVPNRLEKARELAAVSGVLAFQDSLADMRDSMDVSSLNNTGMSSGQASAEKTERAILSAAAKTGSGGIKTAALSRDTGGAALSGRETTRVTSALASGAAEDVAGSSASLGGRSDESIRRIMDRNKGAIFAIYNRALRKNPRLSGKLVFEMQIEASGAISELALISSELGDDKLSRKILSRIRMIRFEPEQVVTTTVNYSFDFLPY